MQSVCITITFTLSSLPVLREYNQNTNKWQPVELSPLALCSLTKTQFFCKLDSIYLQTFDNLCESDCSHSKSVCNYLQKGYLVSGDLCYHLTLPSSSGQSQVWSSQCKVSLHSYHYLRLVLHEMIHLVCSSPQRILI